MVVNKFVEVIFGGTAFVRTVFVVSLISSHIIAESLIILVKCLPFSQLHVAGFQI